MNNSTPKKRLSMLAFAVICWIVSYLTLAAATLPGKLLIGMNGWWTDFSTATFILGFVSVGIHLLNWVLED